ncbi:hypothetical protein EZS27_023200 [termite gut metagenome]|uniref:Bro-N domain-containing protein n=1 Tax=termite gut metagenome TaxID=433724 RepID=A0A5J4R3E1_9ZZZZ
MICTPTGAFLFYYNSYNMHITKNAIKIFESPDFGKIRTAGTSEQPLFCLTDLCKVLNLTTKGVNQRLDKEVISNYPLETSGGTQQALFVNEDGLYDVILESRKPEARQFRKWITSEVLPSIRKTGQYSNDSLMLSKLREKDREIAALRYCYEREISYLKERVSLWQDMNNHTQQSLFHTYDTLNKRTDLLIDNLEKTLIGKEGRA